MLKVLSYILCDLDPKVKVIGQKAGICDGVPSTSALVFNLFIYLVSQRGSRVLLPVDIVTSHQQIMSYGDGATA